MIKELIVGCAKSAACRAKGIEYVANGAIALIGAYGLDKVKPCLLDDGCRNQMISLIAAGAKPVVNDETLESWMADNSSKPPAGTADFSQTGSIMPDPEDPLGEKEEAKDFVFKPSRKSLQHAYARHADHWGFTENANNQSLQRYEQALREFMRASDTVVKPGLYRGTPVIHYYNRISKLWVSVTREGNIGGAWRLYDNQLTSLETLGKVTFLFHRSEAHDVTVL